MLMPLITFFAPLYFLSLTISYSRADRVRNNSWVYDSIRIDDPAEHGSSGIYFRISQKGVDYLADLASRGLPKIMHRMALPMIRESGLIINDAVITKMDEPHILVKFLPDYGTDLSVRLPEVGITGGTELAIFFATYRAQMSAQLGNLTVNMRIFIHRNLTEESTSVEVTNCTVNPGSFLIKFYGPEASEFYAIADLIQSGVDTAIRDKICTLPPLMLEFIEQKIQLLSQPQTDLDDEPLVKGSRVQLTDEPSVFDHICSSTLANNRRTTKLKKSISNDVAVSSAESSEKESPEVDMAGLNEDGTDFSSRLFPDVTLHYPPKFSSKDLIFGVGGGFIHNGLQSPAFIKRPKIGEIEVRDQMIGLILSEYVPNTLFWHIFNSGIGHISVSYSHRQIPRIMRSMSKLVCSECRLQVNANLTTTPPKALIDRNGITLLLEGDIGAHFWRKNRTYNILSANGQLRASIKPHFRHSRLYSDVFLSGVDFKFYRAGMDGLVAGAVRKLLNFLIPNAIWPKIQQRLRLVVNHKGVIIPTLCTVKFTRLHLDYLSHAAIISSDFDVDLPLLIDSFKKFVEMRQRSTKTRRELAQQFRYF